VCVCVCACACVCVCVCLCLCVCGARMNGCLTDVCVRERKFWGGERRNRERGMDAHRNDHP